MNYEEQQFLNLGKAIMIQGQSIKQRNGARITRPNCTMSFDLSNQTIPLITTRFTDFRNIKAELLWFLSGSNKVTDLHKLAEQEGAKGKFWDAWALTQEEVDEWNSQNEFKDLEQEDVGTIGFLYGSVWTGKFESDFSEDCIRQNQIKRLISEMKENPYDTQHLLTTYCYPAKYDKRTSRAGNVYAGNGVLSPCHGIHVQFNILPPTEETPYSQLYCLATMRSQDFFVGTPYNIAMYATLAHMVAKCLPNTQAVELMWVGANTHIYANQIDAVKEQVEREPHDFPVIAFADKPYNDLTDFGMQDIKLVNYQFCSPQIPYPVSP